MVVGLHVAGDHLHLHGRGPDRRPTRRCGSCPLRRHHDPGQPLRAHRLRVHPRSCRCHRRGGAARSGRQGPDRGTDRDGSQSTAWRASCFATPTGKKSTSPGPASRHGHPAAGLACGLPPLNIIYVDQQLVVDAVGLAREVGTGWHSHCSEAANDPVFYLEEYDRRPVEWLAEEGLLDQRATLAHGIFLDDREVGTGRGFGGTGIAYCPISHQYIALGVMRLRDLRRAGATVGLGLDGGSGHRLDMFACMKQAVLLQRVHTQNPTESNGEEAIELATRVGAEYMGVEAGVIAPGRLADLVIVDQSAPHHAPLHRTVASVVYSTSPSDVTHTIVGGEVIFENGRCTMVDEAAVLEEANGRAADLVARAGLTPLLEPWRAPPVPSGKE